jgi:hypothetical protein
MRVKVRKATTSDYKEVLSLLKELRISGYKEMGVKDIKVRCGPEGIRTPDLLAENQMS